MVQAPSAALVDVLRLPASARHQLENLRQIKNIIIGHDQRKEATVRHGLIESLVQVLAASEKAAGKRSLTDGQDGYPALQSRSWTDEDKAWLQATIIVGSIAAGGKQFLPPLLAADIETHLLPGLSPDNPPRLVSATLQALKNIALSWSALSAVDQGDDRPGLKIFTRDSIASFSTILRHPVSSKQFTLTCDIIASAAQSQKTKALLAVSDILELLAALLVSHSIQTRHQDRHAVSSYLPPSPPTNSIPNILSAISTIVSGSCYRVQRFIHCRHIRDWCLPASHGETDRHSHSNRYGLHGSESALLPPVHVSTYKSVSFNAASSAFPVMSSLDPNSNPNRPSFNGMPTHDADQTNAVVDWLLHLARSLRGSQRLAALRLLALVERAADSEAANPTPAKPVYLHKTRERERQCALLAVPLAVKLVQEGLGDTSGEEAKDRAEVNAIKEEACEVLAILIGGSRELQAAAVEAGAIKYVCPVLRKSFDSVPLSKPMWSATSTSVQDHAPATRQLGDRGLPDEVLHAMRCRLGALEAIAAIAQKEDIHRKAIVDAGVVTCMIDSLKPFPQDLESNIAHNHTTLGPKDGNATAVVLAACHAAQSMSRSVSLLRTSLIDAGIAKPVLALLRHHIPDVQIAATDVCANLVLDFSPMREDLVSCGVVGTLCGHAKRSTPALTLSSLWALKHLMLGAPKEMKKTTLEELGTGWLVAAISGQQREGSGVHNNGGVSIALSSANAAGEQVDLLNPSSMDVDGPPSHEAQRDGIDEDDEDGELMYDEASDTHYHASSLRSTLRSTLHRPERVFNTNKYLSSVRDTEQDPAVKARREDFAIQEEALHFLRNLLNGEDCVQVLEHVLQQLGHQKLFDLLTVKLAPLPASLRHLSPPSITTSASATAASSSSGPHYNPTQLVLATVYVIIHVSNGSSKHKQLLIAQKPLLRAWLPHFASADRRVRVACVWAFNSLTWIEEERDRADARQRAHELRALGIEDAVRALAHDPDLDVKERVKTAMRQIDAL